MGDPVLPKSDGLLALVELDHGPVIGQGPVIPILEEPGKVFRATTIVIVTSSARYNAGQDRSVDRCIRERSRK